VRIATSLALLNAREPSQARLVQLVRHDIRAPAGKIYKEWRYFQSAAQLGRRTTRIFPLFPPPQKNRSSLSDSSHDTLTPVRRFANP
jgi:hypothetical protein